MNRSASVVVFIVFSGAAASAAAQDGVAKIKGSGVARTVQCAETPRVEVTGERNQVRLVGRCDKVKLSGAGHVVRAEGLGKIEMSGLDHRIEWQFALAGTRPKVDDSGIGNTVVQVEPEAPVEAAPAATATARPSQPTGTAAAGGEARTEAGASGVRAEAAVAASGVAVGGAGTIVQRGKTLEIDGAGIRKRVRCDGGSLEINGSGNDIRAAGDCDRIVVNGFGNRVRVEGVRALEVNGMNQDVAWVRGWGDERPRVKSDGLNNSVRQIEAEDFEGGN